MAHATTITDAKGRHAFTIFEEQRLQIPLSRVSPNLTRAILAVEDRRFYAHDGVDSIRLAGALIHDVVNYRAEQGASTITQQLARLSFLTPEKTIRRKLQELVLAGASNARSPRSRSSSCISTRRTSATACTAWKRRRSGTSANMPPTWTSRRRR